MNYAEKAKLYFREMMLGDMFYRFNEVATRRKTMAEAIDEIVDVIWEAGRSAAQQKLEQYTDEELRAELVRRHEIVERA